MFPLNQANKTNYFTSIPRRSIGKHIIAIDPGTSRCQVASTTVDHSLERYPPSHFGTKTPDIRPHKDWPFQMQADSPFPLMDMYYPGNGRSPITGHFLSALIRMDPNKYDPKRRFCLWKIGFHDDIPFDMRKYIQESEDRVGKSCKEVLVDWVKWLYDEVLFKGSSNKPTTLQKQVGSNIAELDIEVVIAVPPGRTAVQHAIVQEAFAQGPISLHQLVLVSEVECLFRSWVEGAGLENSDVGKTFMIVDGGGGFGCIARVRLDSAKPLQFTQEYETEGIICGGETITTEFEKLLRLKVDSNCPNREWVIDKMRQDFDLIWKRQFDGLPQDHLMSVVVLSQPRSDGTIEQVEMSFQEIAACFHHCLKKLVLGIRRQLEKAGDVHYLILGGGLCNNKYIRREIDERFGNLLKIHEISADKEHVVRGAVLTRLYGSIITSRPANKSVGILTLKQVTKELRESQRYQHLWTIVDEIDCLEYYYVIEWLGQRVNDLHEQDSESRYAEARKRHFPSSQQNSPLFVETIYTTDYTPGPETNSSDIDQEINILDNLGNIIHETKPARWEIPWNPSAMNITLSNLETRVFRRRRYREVRYSIMMQLDDVSSRFLVKVWLAKPRDGSASNDQVAFSPSISRPVVLSVTKVSEGLARSLRIGNDVKREPDATPNISGNSQAVGASNHSITAQNETGTRPNIAAVRALEPEASNKIRKNGGCWTCLDKHISCTRRKPECDECVRSQRKCVYERSPSSRLHNEPGLKRRQQSDINPVLKTAVSSERELENRQILSSWGIQPTNSSGTRQDSSEEEDLYGASPPRKRRVRPNRQSSNPNTG